MGSGFESQGAHFKQNPADSSESAGFLRSLNKYSFEGWGVDISSCSGVRCLEDGIRPRSYRGPVLASLRTPWCHYGRYRLPRLVTWCCDGEYLYLCASVIQGFAESRRFVGVRGGFVCAPCLANWGGGGLLRFSALRGGWVFCLWDGEGRRLLVCCMVAECLGWCAVFSGSALRVSHGRSPQRSEEGRSVRVTGAPA